MQYLGYECDHYIGIPTNHLPGADICAVSMANAVVTGEFNCYNFIVQHFYGFFNPGRKHGFLLLETLNHIYFSVKPKEEKKEIVIPLIQVNRWRHAVRPEDLEKKTDKIIEKSADHSKAAKTTLVGSKVVESADQQAANEILAGG